MYRILCVSISETVDKKNGMIKILELKGEKKLWFKNDNFSSEKILLSEVNVIRFLFCP